MAPRRFIAILSFALAFCTVSRADMTFIDQSAFLAHVAPGYYLENFDELISLANPPGHLNNASLAFSSNGFQYTASTSDDLFTVAPDPTQPDNLALSISSGNSLKFTFTSPNVTAVGGDLFPTGALGDLGAGTVTATLDDGSTLSISNAQLNSFGGFTTSIPIMMLTITSTPVVSTEAAFPTIDNLIVGASLPTPEPSTLAMGALGTVAFTAYTQRRFRKRRLA
jgi:hypothetical protein